MEAKFRRERCTQYLMCFNHYLLSHYNDNVREWTPMAGTKLYKVTEIIRHQFDLLDEDEN
jgi:hypothetical protein